MELTTTHLIQGLIMLATIVSGYAIVRNNLSRVMEDLDLFHKNFDKFKASFDSRLDDAESQRAVFSSQIDVLKEINSVKSLEARNRETATIRAELKVLQDQVSHLQHIHNSKHPTVEK
jgi:predicted  nucleic acid-binding Zn-ribbon protein